MSESLHTIFDIRAPGHTTTPPIQHTPNRYSTGLPLYPFNNPALQAPLTLQEVPRSILQHISAFFQPRPILQTTEPKLKSNDIFGYSICIPITAADTRFYFINFNGINLAKGGAQFQDLCAELTNPTSTY